MHQDLDSLIGALKNEKLPLLGADFAGSVWREIYARRQAIRWWTAWENPRVMAAAAAAAVLIGLTTALVAPQSRINDTEALGLDVFSATPRHLPLTMLARR